jgi:hypothetical protein
VGALERGGGWKRTDSAKSQSSKKSEQAVPSRNSPGTRTLSPTERSGAPGILLNLSPAGCAEEQTSASLSPAMD